MTSKQIVDRMKSEGKVWLGGEMEFPAGMMIGEAHKLAVQIASACGYLVRYAGCRSMLEISGGEIPGYIVLDWFSVDNPGPQKVSIWREEAAYTF